MVLGPPTLVDIELVDIALGPALAGGYAVPEGFRITHRLSFGLATRPFEHFDDLERRASATGAQ